jgi:hypothetical protein
MARLLIVVETASLLPAWMSYRSRLGERCQLLLTPEIVVQPGERFRPGDALILKRPFESTIVARIGGFRAMGGYGFGPPGVWVNYQSCLTVPGLDPEDVPPGTEVWSVDRPRRGVQHASHP